MGFGGMISRFGEGLRTPLGLAVAMGLLLALDQASKFWVREHIPLQASSVLIPNLIDLTHVENAGVSFSFLSELNAAIRVPLLTGLSFLAVLALGTYWWRYRHTMNGWADFAFVLILPGAGGNLIDRGVFGTVTDFFHFRFFTFSFFVNNIADIQISLGVGAFLIGMLLARRTDSPGES